MILTAGWAVAGWWPGGATPADQPVRATQASQSRAGTGLPVPRFVSLKNHRTNVRRGPSRQYSIIWEFNRRGLPVEITREFENWRQIRDSEGSEGWVFQGMLSSHRAVLVAPWAQAPRGLKALYEKPKTSSPVVARHEPLVLATVNTCTQNWCLIKTGKVTGWVAQNDLWGVYPNEVIDSATIPSYRHALHPGIP
ncbi:MAG: SH3 domain-containing protein [Alphaproteobacteria bacterium]